MNIISDLKTYTASEARDNLYTLIRTASTGLKSFEITLRGSNPVLIINKAELEAWQETFDILSSKKEANSLRKARKQKRNIPHNKMLKAVRMNDEA